MCDLVQTVCEQSRICTAECTLRDESKITILRSIAKKFIILLFPDNAP